MPNYLIKSPTTGQTIHMSGNTPPSKAIIDAAFAHMNQGGQAPQAPGGDWQHTVGDAAPTVMSFLGQLLGGTVGGTGGAVAGAAVPGADLTGVPEVAGGVTGERIGQTVGGAGGQAFGQFIKNLLEKQNPTKDVLQNAGEGALYSNIPGGKAGAGIIKNLLTRFGGGAAVGAGATAMQEFNPKKPNMGLDVGNIATSGITSGVLNSTAFPLLSSMTNKVTHDLPQAIQKIAVENIPKVKAKLQNDSLNYRFGQFNLPLVKKLGLSVHPDLTVENMNAELPKIKQAALDTQAQLNDKLKKVELPASEIINGLKQFGTELGQATPQVAKAINDFITKSTYNIDKLGNATIKKTVNGQDLNNLKHIVGKGYDPTNPASINNRIYNFLQTTIQDSSGVPEEVKALNDQAHTLSQIQGRFRIIMNAFDSFPEKYTPAGIDNAINDAVKGNIDKLMKTVDFLNIPLSILGLMGHGFLGYLVGRGVLPTATKELENPGIAKNVSSALLKSNKPSQAIINLLKQLSIRGVSSNPSVMNPQSPSPIPNSTGGITPPGQ